MGDRDADLADFSVGQSIVGVVAGLGRKVERDRQARSDPLPDSPGTDSLDALAVECPEYVRISHG